MKKKIVALMLVACMVLSVCACGQKTTEKSTKDVEKTESSTSTSQYETTSGSTSAEEEKGLYPLVDEPITIKGMVVGGAADAKIKNERKIWQRVGELTGITIEWEVVEQEALNTRLASGNLPDIFHANFSQSIVTDYGVLGGKFLNVNDYLEYMPHLVKTYEDYPTLKKATTETNGEIYRLGTVSVAATSTKVRPHVNMEVLRNAGITKVPETIDEFYQALVALKEKNGEAGFIPYIGSKINSSYWNKMLFAAFGTMVGYEWEADDNGTVIFSRTSEQMKRYLTFMNKLYEEGLIHKESSTLDTLVRRDIELTSGNIAFLESSSSGSINAEHFASGKIEMETCKPFTSEYDNTQTVVAQNIVTMYGMFINADTKYAKEICQMLDIMYAEEEVAEGTGLRGMAFCYGVEGECWVINDDGKTYSFIVPEEYNSGATHAQSEWVFLVAGRLDLFKNLMPLDPGNNSTIRQEGYVANVHPYSTKYEFPTELFKLTDDETYVIENKYTDIDSYCKEMEVKFITGLEDIETGWDTFVENLNKMGLQEVVKAYQDAYDRWEGK